MLKIRRFVQGEDEAVWNSVWNRSFTDFGEFRSMSVEDMLMKEKNPSFDAAGMLIAELNGEPVGIANARVDKRREEKKGFIRVLGVVPEHRGKGIGRAMAEKAIESMRERGMQTVETSALTDKRAAIGLWESMSFQRVRVFSLMKASLKNIPSGVGENRDVQLREFENGSLEDLKLLTWLTNETFKEHYNWRPHTIDEIRYFLEQDPQFKDQENLFTLLEGKPVGYVGTGIDKKYNAERNVRHGWIMSIGVLKQNRLKGVGKRLMIEGMKLLRAKDMTHALLGVDDQNPTNAIKLYENMGFKAVEKDIAYRKTIQ
jgi:ribosomal protein S18 acetylase RimI-like enzyme